MFYISCSPCCRHWISSLSMFYRWAFDLYFMLVCLYPASEFTICFRQIKYLKHFFTSSDRFYPSILISVSFVVRWLQALVSLRFAINMPFSSPPCFHSTSYLLIWLWSLVKWFFFCSNIYNSRVFYSSGSVSSSLIVGGREETAETHYWEQVTHSASSGYKYVCYLCFQC